MIDKMIDKTCKEKFYGTLMLGRHLVKQECSKPDIKPLFQPRVTNVSIILSDSSGDNDMWLWYEKGT